VKKILIAFIGLILLAGVLIYLFRNELFYQPCSPAEKPHNVPSGAIWKGGCDGGNWIELISIDGEKYRFRIYRDWDGVLQMDADFILVDCNGIALNSSNWRSYIGAYLNEAISIHNQSNEDQNQHCVLKPVYPAYAGEEWEIIKEKGECP
jgi:hypothetical protein